MLRTPTVRPMQLLPFLFHLVAIQAVGDSADVLPTGCVELSIREHFPEVLVGHENKDVFDLLSGDPFLFLLGLLDACICVTGVNGRGGNCL